MSNKTLKKKAMSLEEINIAIGNSLDVSNIELEKLAQGPVNYAISNMEFSVPIKEVEIDKEKRIQVLFPETVEEMSKTQYMKISIKATPKIVPPTKTISKLNVEDIEGIGDIIGGKLRALNITEVSDLALASAEDIYEKINVSEEKAREFISMAKLMVKSSFAGLEGIDEESAELLVKGVKIDSLEKLAVSDATDLFNRLNEAVNKKIVRVPKTYKLTVDDVKRWISSARRRI